MEAALGIIVVMLVAIIGWLLAHSSQCAAFHERVAKLEQWVRDHGKKQ